MYDSFVRLKSGHSSTHGMSESNVSHRSYEFLVTQGVSPNRKRKTSNAIPSAIWFKLILGIASVVADVCHEALPQSDTDVQASP